MAANAGVNELMNELTEAIKDAVNDALAKNPITPPSPSNKRSSKKGNGASANTNLNVGDIVAQVLAAIQPTLVALVSSGVASATEKMLSSARRMEDSQTETVKRHEREILSLKARIERHEQYTRRETVKIMNLPVVHMCENGEEDTDRGIIDLAAAVGVELTPGDISVSHRVPSNRPGPRPVVCRFTTRNARTRLMVAKRKLRERQDAYSSVFVADHLTPERARLLRKLKAREDVSNIFSIEGKLRVTMKRDHNQEERVTIDSLDDLVGLGLPEEDLVGLGIFAPLTYAQD